MSPPALGCATTDLIPTKPDKVGASLDVINHPCQIWNQTIHNCDFSIMGLMSFISALPGLSPLTWLKPSRLPMIFYDETLVNCCAAWLHSSEKPTSSA